MRTLLMTVVLVLTVSFGGLAMAAPVQWSVNGHYYDIVSAALCWPEARDLAAGMSWHECAGHLVTITSYEEQSFLEQAFGTALRMCWLGGYQDPEESLPTDNWHWVTCEPWVYANWAPDEPNDDHGGSEYWLEVHGDYSPFWNDLGSNNCPRPRFVIEYESQPSVVEPKTLGKIKALLR